MLCLSGFELYSRWVPLYPLRGLSYTVRHEMFAGVYFCGSAIFSVSQELLFAIRTDLFFLLGINFGDFQKVPSQPRDKGP